jgi:FkbM family methyltransferase
MNQKRVNIDWVNESKNAEANALSEFKSKKYIYVSEIVNQLHFSNKVKKACEIGAGPAFLLNLISPGLTYDLFDKYPASQCVSFFDLDQYASYNQLSEYDCIVMMGTLEYAHDYVQVLKHLKKSGCSLIIYMTHPLISSRLTKPFNKKWRDWSGFNLIQTAKKFKRTLQELGYTVINEKVCSFDLSKLIESRIYVISCKISESSQSNWLPLLSAKNRKIPFLQSLYYKLFPNQNITIAGLQIPLNLRLKQERMYFENINNVVDKHIIGHFSAPGDVCVDIGANIGLTAAFFLESDASHVIAIEPVNRLAKKLTQLDSEKITVINSACSSSPGTQKLYLSSMHDQGHTLKEDYTKKFHWIFGNNSKAQPYEMVNVDTLDNVLRNFDKIDYLKIDAEGSEIDILRGSTRLLDDFSKKPRIVQIEIIFKEEFNSILSIMENYYSKIHRVFIDKKTYRLISVDALVSDPYQLEIHEKNSLVSSPTFIFSN